MDALRQSAAVGGKLTVWLAVPAAIVVLLVGGRFAVRLKSENARASWKTATLPRLAALSITNEEIRRELDALKTGTTPNTGFRWAQEHMLILTNGEHLIYASRHGFNNGFVDHLFLGHGSDGRWFYSTYHFCNSMAGVTGEDPPGSITEFAARYAAREFDGKSDECLQHTWPVKK